MGVLSVLKMQNGTAITYQVVYGHKWIFYTVWTFSEVSCCKNPNFFQGILLLATHNENQGLVWISNINSIQTHTHTHTHTQVRNDFTLNSGWWNTWLHNSPNSILK